MAYVTLLERHILGLRQNRLGPSKNFFFGLLQPFLDAFKLFQKFNLVPSYSSFFFYWFVPIFFFLVLFLQFPIYQNFYVFWSLDSSILFFMCVMGLGVFRHFFVGFFRVSKYRSLGSLRAVVQRVSYEVVFFLLIFIMIGFFVSFSVFIRGGLYFFIFVLLFIFLILSEVGRAPFDFTEGESELVRGFNLEYGSIIFIFLFLSEYGSLLAFRVFCGGLFFGWDLWVFFPLPLFFISVFLMFRSSFPRYRYDILMSFFWFIFLPLIIQLVLFYVIFRLFIIWVFFLFLLLFFLVITFRSLIQPFFRNFFFFTPLSNNLGVLSKFLVGGYLIPFIFSLVFFILLGVFLPYIFLLDFFFIFSLISYTGLVFWWIAFLYLSSSERLSLFWCKSGDILTKSYFLFFIEVLSTIIQPFSLMVRLFVNFMVGVLLLNLAFILSDSFAFFSLGVFPILFELGVFLVQSFIFTYLISSYFVEV